MNRLTCMLAALAMLILPSTPALAKLQGQQLLRGVTYTFRVEDQSGTIGTALMVRGSRFATRVVVFSALGAAG